MLTRRKFLQLFGAAIVSGSAMAGYAFGIEPLLRLRAQRHEIRPKNWPQGLRLKIAVVSDLHACRPWMDEPRIELVVAQTNALGADLIVLLGDYTAGHRFTSGEVHAKDWSRALAGLSAPLGVFAVLGNHDWWEDETAQRRGTGPTFVHRALGNVGIPVLENDAVRLTKGGEVFWLAGLGDQIAFLGRGRSKYDDMRGIDDLPGTLKQVSDDAPVILLAHEPDIFPDVPDRVAVTLSGHTHGGQVRLFGYSPIVPSVHGNRFAYGHVEEAGRHLVVSGGLGCSILPVRFGVPPEITVVELAA